MANHDQRGPLEPSRPSILSDEERILESIRRIIRAVDLHSRRLVERYGLTGPQIAMLGKIVRSQTISPAVLARELHLSQPTVTGIIQRLEKRGLVTRTSNDADRRSVLLTSTSEGTRIIEQAPSLLQDSFRASLASLEEWERLQILSTLQRVASLMDAEQIDASPHLTPGEIAPDPAPDTERASTAP